MPEKLDPEPLYETKEAVVGGFGFDEVDVETIPETGKPVFHGGRSSNKLRFALTTVIPNEIYATYRQGTVYSSHICAQMEQRDDHTAEGVCYVSPKYSFIRVLWCQ